MLFALDLLGELLGGLFHFVVSPLIIVLVFYVIGKILLTDIVIRMIVWVFIALEKRALEMCRYIYPHSLFYVRHSVIDCHICRI